MGDVLEVARHMTLGIPPVVGCTCTDNLPIVPMEQLSTKYYIRFSVASIVSMAEVVECLYNKEVEGEVVINDDIKAAIDEYYKQYGVKE